MSHLLPHSGDDLLAYLLARAFLHLLPDDLRHSGFDLRFYFFPRGLGDSLYHLLMRTFPHLAGDFRVNRLPHLLGQYGVRLLVNIVFDIGKQLALQAGKLLFVIVYRQRVQFNMQLCKIAALFLQAIVGGIDDRFEDLPSTINESVAVVVDLRQPVRQRLNAFTQLLHAIQQCPGAFVNLICAVRQTLGTVTQRLRAIQQRGNSIRKIGSTVIQRAQAIT